MARRLLIAAAVLVVSIVVCTSAFSQSPSTAQTNLPANCDGTPAPDASEQDSRLLESTLARIARGDTDAIVSVGFFYQSGQGVKRDVNCTIKLWEIAGNAGNVTAMHMLGMAYKGMANFPTNYWLARQWLEKAAEHGDRDAAFAVAEIYDGGHGVPPDGNLAFEWYKRVLNWPGAPKDDYTAQWSTEAIAELYKWGKGVPQDDKLAVEWFQRSIEAGSISSIRELAWMYRNGRGVEKNDQIAQSLSDRYNKLADARLTPEEKIPDCDATRLELSLSLHRNVNSGDVEGIVELRNVSDRTCRVEGASLNFTSPTVRENFPVKTCQTCTADGRDVPGSHVSLQPGGFAHMSVQWKDAPQTGGPKCVDISGMNVSLSFRSPQSRGFLSIAFPPPAPLVCSTASYSSLITGRDPYSSAADAARLAAIYVAMPKDAYYPGEEIYLRVTVPVIGPLSNGKRCPQLFLLIRDSTGFTNYRPVGGPNDYSCKIVTSERGEATLRVKLQLWSDKDLSERWLQFFQYTSMDTGPGSWKLLAQSPPVEYRVADPAKIVRTWGPEVKGLALDVTLDKTTFAVGEDVAAHVAFRNISAAEPMIEPRDNRIDIVIQDAGGQRVYPQTGDGYPAFFSGPGVVPTIAPGSTITAEMNVWLLGVPPGTYAVLGRWEAYVVNCAPGLVCVDPAGAASKPYAVVTSNPTTIHVVPAGTSTPPRATKR